MRVLPVKFRLALDPVLVAVLVIAIAQAVGTGADGRPAELGMAAAAALLHELADIRRIDAVRDGAVELFAQPDAVVAVVADAREPVAIRLFFIRLRDVAALARDDIALQEEFRVLVDGLFVRPILDALRVNGVIGVQRAAFRRGAVMDDDVVGVEFEFLARDVLMVDFALRLFHRARLRAVAVKGLVAVELDARLPRRDLDEMRVARQLDLLFCEVARDGVRRLEEVAVRLQDVHFADGGKFARRLVIRELVTLECQRRGLRLVRHVVGIAQVLLHVERVFRDLELGVRPAVLALAPAHVLDEIKPVRARIARAAELRRGDARELRQGARQRRRSNQAEAERDAVWEKRFHVCWLLLTLRASS